MIIFPKVYPVNQGTGESTAPYGSDSDGLVARPPYTYLHGEAERLAGYDICQADIDFFYSSLVEVDCWAFLCEVKYGGVIGSKIAVCCSHLRRGRGYRYVMLVDDVKSFKTIHEDESIGNKNKAYLMYTDQEEWLKENHYETYSVLFLNK